MQNEIQEFLRFKSSHIKQRSLDDYYLWLKRFDDLIKEPLEKVQDQHFTKFHNIISIAYSEKSIEHAFNILHTYFTFWKGERGCINPARIVIPHARSNSHPLVTREQYDKLQDQLEENYFPDLQRKLWLSFLWDCGMRIGELTSINISDVSTERRQAIIKTEKTYKNRAIFWSEATNILLTKYLAIRNEIKRSDALFIGLYNNGDYSDRLTSRAIERSIATLCRHGKVGTVVPHSFRHAFIQRLISKGLSLPEVIQLSGHQSQLSVEHYMRLGNDRNEFNARRAM